MSASNDSFRYDLEVPPDGRLEVQAPFPPGSLVSVIVVKTPGEDFNNLLAASTSSTDFWDNPYDDEDWNDA